MSTRLTRRGRPRSAVPSYRLHKSTGQAVVTIGGRDIYLGQHGTEVSRKRYGELIARHAAGQPVQPDEGQQEDGGPTVDELCWAYREFCRTHYVKHGKPTSEVCLVEMTVKPLHELFGAVPARDFGPKCLKTLRDKLVELGWCRNTINQAVGRIRRMFKWAVAEEMIGPDALHRLQAVAALRSGRTEAPDRRKRMAVSQEQIDAVREKVRPMVRDMIDVQLACGARSGELLALTTAMIDRSGSVWVATLQEHKTEHHGHGPRKLYFGPVAQAVLSRYLSADPSRKLFRMRRDAYCRAIIRGCEQAFGMPEEIRKPKPPKLTAEEIARGESPRKLTPEELAEFRQQATEWREKNCWSPHWLRHTYVTRIREQYGIEAAQVLAGHAAPDMTAVYSAKMDTLAASVAAKLA